MDEMNRGIPPAEPTENGREKQSLKKLIITADDYGPVPTVNAGIEKALRKGCVNTVSAFVNGPEDAERIRGLRRRFPRANIGLHLTLTSGRPVSGIGRVPTLLKGDGTGEFMDYVGYNYEKVSLGELAGELEAQIESFRNLGWEPDHLSCHHGLLGIFPDFFKIYMDLAIRYDVPIRNPIAISRTGKKGFRGSKMKRDALVATVKSLEELSFADLLGSAVHITQANMERMMAEYSHGRLRVAGYLIDTFYKKGTSWRLRRIMDRLPEGKASELVVHLKAPGRESVAPNGIDAGYYPGREKELETLCRDGFLESLFKRYGVEFSGFSSIR